MRKAQDNDYDKGNIVVVICDTVMPYQLTKSWRRLFNCRSDDLHVATKNRCLSSFPVSSNL